MAALKSTLAPFKRVHRGSNFPLHQALFYFGIVHWRGWSKRRCYTTKSRILTTGGRATALCGKTGTAPVLVVSVFTTLTGSVAVLNLRSYLASFRQAPDLTVL